MGFFYPHWSNAWTDFSVRWISHEGFEWTEMQSISRPKGASFLMVSNNGYWHNKANSVGMQQLVHPSTNKPLLTLNCSPNASKECSEIPGQQDPPAEALYLHLLLEIIPPLKSNSIFLYSHNGSESWHLHSSSRFFNYVLLPFSLKLAVQHWW